MKQLVHIFVFLCLSQFQFVAQTQLFVDPTLTTNPVSAHFQAGIFYVPKTSQAADEFANCGLQFSIIRSNIIESVLNNTANLNDCLNLLESVETQLVDAANRCDRFLFIFEKMPAWLSSSSNPAPAATPGWYILNTKPPASWTTWQTVVDSITDKIVNQFGINNASFEIWNEPDIGSWTGTKADYFQLYKTTFDGIKQANPSTKVGGPAVNFWSNNLSWEAPYGYKTDALADSSLIGELLDSVVIWNKIPDFISFHNFNLTHQEYKNADDYFQQKLSSLSLPAIPLLVSEWNAPSAVRDSPLAQSFMLKSQLEMSRTSLEANTIAAWQDFSQNTNEFHNDYGLLTYGAIHKPAYKSIQLSSFLKGNHCQLTSSSLFDGTATVLNDTLRVFIANYSPLAIVEALNHTLYEGQFDIYDLENGGYIDIVTTNLSYLDSIYRGLISLGNTTTLEQAINASIPIYAHFDSLQKYPRDFSLELATISGNGTAKMYLIDSTHNNFQWKYDSLLMNGFTQASAISFLFPNQTLSSQSLSIVNGTANFTLQANALAFLEIALNELSIEENNISTYSCFPNPSEGIFTIQLNEKMDSKQLIVTNIVGEELLKQSISEKEFLLNLSGFSTGVYFLRLSETEEVKTLLVK